MKKIDFKNDKVVLLIVTIVVYSAFYLPQLFTTGNIFGESDKDHTERMHKEIEEIEVDRIKLKTGFLTFNTKDRKLMRILDHTKQCLYKAKKWDSNKNECIEFKNHKELMRFSSKDNLQKMGFSLKRYKQLLNTTTFMFANSIEDIN
jgi:hypothetical protein